MTTVKELAKEMKSLIDNNDYEKTHSIADDILIELIELLAPNSDVIKELIDDYDKVGKWYA